LTNPSIETRLFEEALAGISGHKRVGGLIPEAYGERIPGLTSLKTARQKQLYLAALVLIIALVNSGCSPPMTGSPEATNGENRTDAGVLKFEPDSVEFGTLENVKPQITRIVGTNSTDTSLHISQVKTSCGCVLAEFSETEVLPGKQTTLRVLLDPDKADPEFEVHVSIFYEERPEVDVVPVRGRLPQTGGAPDR
jgi:hypothetical protein